MNGVAKDVLLHRLRERCIPEIWVKWIDAFCSDQRATIVVNGEASRQTELPQAGLPQGSPLSPILFLFFNANLLKGGRNGRYGSIAFVDDYTAWVIGKSAEDNLRVIQQHIIPRVEQWKEESGATFEAEKTKVVHFKRRGEIQPSSVIIKGQEVEAVESVKT